MKILLMCLGLLVQAEEIGLKWDVNSETNVVGYTVFVSPVPGAKLNATQTIQITNANSMRLSIPAGQPRYFQVTARTPASESLPSNEVLFVVPVLIRTGRNTTRLSFTQVKASSAARYFLEMSDDLNSWTRQLGFTPTVTDLHNGFEQVEAIIEHVRFKQFFRVAVDLGTDGI